MKGVAHRPHDRCQTSFHLCIYLLYSYDAGTLNVNAGTTGSNTFLDGDIRLYSGTATTNPVNLYSIKCEPGNINTITLPAVVETFVSGEWYVAGVSSIANDLPTSAAPTLSHVFTSTGINAYEIGDLIPSGAPGTELFTYAASTSWRVAAGVTIKPLGAATSGSQLILTGAGQ
jgi:hypothetical protein